MQALAVTAPAKINLTLRVPGKRADGYHEVDSVVAFAHFGDHLSLTPGDGLTLEADGPFAASLDSSNLVLEAANHAMRCCPDVRAGAFHLTKNIPVAAGLGGGSADAAAALRLLVQANPAAGLAGEIKRIAQELGSDVTVCLESRAAMMRGTGEQVVPLDTFPEIAAVLVNPGAALATADIFNELGASALPPDFSPEIDAPSIHTLEALLAVIEASGNDLEVPATRLAPAIGAVMAALTAAPGCRIAGLSGSGATCFGIFGSQAQAQVAAARLSTGFPDWWVQASALQ